MFSDKLAFAAALAACLVLPGAAGAVVGGAPGEAAIERASLMVLSSNGGVCSGIVLAPDVIATAAHCLTGAAEYRAHWRDERGEPVLAAIAAIVVHPDYDPRAIETRRRSIDLALARLAEPLPARFVPALLDASSASAAERVVLAGFGVETESDARGLTSGTFRAATLDVVEPYGPSRILVWLSGRGAGACHGDSGGPILRGDAVFALTSWTRGEGARACGSLSQGILLGPQRGFLDATLASWGRSARWR